MRVAVVALGFALVVLLSGTVLAAGRPVSKIKAVVTYSFDVKTVFEMFVTDYTEGEWVSAVGPEDTALQRKIQSCLRIFFDRSTWHGDKKVVVIPYNKQTGSVMYVDEIVDRHFPEETRGFLVLTVQGDDFVAAFIYSKSTGEAVGLGDCK
jgi:hypothetical protein